MDRRRRRGTWTRRLRRRRTRSDGWGCSRGISWRCARRRAVRSGPRESSRRAMAPRTTTSFACRRAWRPTSASYPRSAPATWTTIRPHRRATKRTNPRDRRLSSRGSSPFRARPTSRSPPRASPRRSSPRRPSRWTRGRPGAPRSARWESTFERRGCSRRGTRSSRRPKSRPSRRRGAGEDARRFTSPRAPCDAKRRGVTKRRVSSPERATTTTGAGYRPCRFSPSRRESSCSHPPPRARPRRSRAGSPARTPTTTILGGEWMHRRRRRSPRTRRAV
mmetsp:Transcript_5502/g.22614  ORF Transcript_5502/g.22614 Transcript_5502/m.22614 type:complete len:277 (-) Transcript_5502:688-1518(-)